ncbi:hypothetical protein [Microbispora sp. NPDC046933]|uniref:hypothetical protein n=1 Tax=Microbispora sp. NPDC046933 TaxID=3155618 RepID=UPI0033EBC69C
MIHKWDPSDADDDAIVRRDDLEVMMRKTTFGELDVAGAELDESALVAVQGGMPPNELYGTVDWSYWQYDNLVESGLMAYEYGGSFFYP